MLRGLTVVVAALALAGVASAEGIYGDANGENHLGFPWIDINNVSVSNDPAAGTLTFRISLAGAPAIVGQAQVMVLLWPDGVGGSPVATLALTPGGADGATGSYANGTVTLTANTADLGIRRSVSFEVLTVPDYPNHATYFEDTAPDIGTWSYTLSAAEPPAPTATTVTQVTALFAGKAKPGSTVSVRGLGLRLSTGAGASATGVHCSAHLGKPVLAGTGVGGCTFALPKTSKGKVLDITSTGTYGSETVSSSDQLTVG